MNIIEELKWRGLIYDCTDIDNLSKKVESESITLYCGFDPTADSLHLGSLLPIITLMRFQKMGHNVLPLVGGSTGMIGDPSGKSSERNLQTLDVVNKNVEGIKNILSKFLKFDDRSFLVNNYDWTKKINILEFLRDYGKYFNINYMMSKDSVKSRLNSGISYTEFSYMLLQALDFKYLYDKYNCILQIGGQDQWGNITAGFELIRKTNSENNAFALTIPLLLKSDGTKFGKSAGNALWLDKNKTSAYEIYQYLLNVDDDMVIKLLKYYTFLNAEDIERIEKEMIEAPHLRKAQKVLAQEVIILIHGEKEFEKVLNISNSLFSGEINSIDANDLLIALNDVPSIELESEISLIDLMINLNVASSKREAREFISNNAISINGIKITDSSFIVTKEKAKDSKLVVIKRGKKKYYIAVFK